MSMHVHATILLEQWYIDTPLQDSFPGSLIHIKHPLAEKKLILYSYMYDMLELENSFN